MNELALEIRGFVDSIDLDVPSEDAQFEMGLDPRLKWESSEGFRDKRGNLIAPLYGMLKLSGRPTFLGFRIYPAYRLSREPSSSSIETIGVDLSRFGFGDHGRLMTVRSLPPTRVPDTSNPYFLYSTLPPEAVPGAEGVFEQAGILAAKAEDAFGFEPGNRLDSIFLVPSKRWNASVRFANPRSFFIWDEMFEDLLSGSAGDIVFHEVCHSLDFQFSFSTHKTLLGIFDALSKAEDTDLFRAINESAFFETKGGHSGDNVFEFFATLTNSIRSPKWREKVLAMDKRVRALYYHSLKALAEALATKHAPLVSSPIYKLVGERIPELEGMSERPGDKAPYPDFSDVIQEPVSSIISKGPDPLRVIMAQDFEREVLGASEPVILVMFYDNVHTSIDHLRSIWEQYRSRGKVVFMPMREAEFTAEHTDKQTSTGRPFIFWRGKLASKPKFGELKEEETQQRVETALVEIERLHPTPIPIIGPLIDLFRQ